MGPDAAPKLGKDTIVNESQEILMVFTYYLLHRLRLSQFSGEFKGLCKDFPVFGLHSISLTCLKKGPMQTYVFFKIMRINDGLLT